MRRVDLIEKRAKMIREWRKWIPRVVKAILEIYPNAEVYLIGSIVEGRITGASDIDILIVTSNPPRSPQERALIKIKIEDLAELPDHHPLELHFTDPRSKEYYLHRAGPHKRLA